LRIEGIRIEGFENYKMEGMKDVVGERLRREGTETAALARFDKILTSKPVHYRFVVYPPASDIASAGLA
jgi:hypothetical protein